MNNNILRKAVYRLRFIFTMMIWVFIIISCEGTNSGDIIRENITIEEAKRLVSFSICIPSYTPLETDPIPQIIYFSDSENVPEEIFIRLRYKSVVNNQKMFVVYQRYTNNEGMKMEYSKSQIDSKIGGAAVRLVDWITPKFSSSTQRVDAIEQVKINADSYQMNQKVWWFYEITEPNEYRSTMTEWVVDHVEYWILSFLPEDEITEVTLSMFNCYSK